MLIKLTSYFKDDNYTTDESGLLMKDRMIESPAIINTDEVVFAFPAKNGVASTVIMFRNGRSLDFKETLDEIIALVNPAFSAVTYQ